LRRGELAVVPLDQLPQIILFCLHCGHAPFVGLRRPKLVLELLDLALGGREERFVLLLDIF
jgi:hypothetical protein